MNLSSCRGQNLLEFNFSPQYILMADVIYYEEVHINVQDTYIISEPMLFKMV